MTVLVLSAATLVLASPLPLHFHLHLPGIRVPLEAAGGVVAGMAAALAYLWYSFTGAPSTLLLALAFAVRSVNQVVFVAFLSRDVGSANGVRFVWFWTAGRLAIVALLIAAAAVRNRPPVRTRHPLLLFLGSLVVVVGIVTVAQTWLWARTAALPSLGHATPAAAERANGVLPGLTALALALGLIGLIGNLVPGFMFLGQRRGGPPRAQSYGHGDWLAVALIVAGFSHLHYMLFPAVLPGELSTADVLRFLFVVVLMVGLAWEVRALLLLERRHGEEMEELSRMKTDVHRLLSHDLMHSVGVLRTYAAILTRGWDSMSDEDRRFSAERIDR